MKKGRSKKGEHEKELKRLRAENAYLKLLMEKLFEESDKKHKIHKERQ
ncbi:hypothetical protein [Fervidobacterium gondwanense]|uniref:Uncharacterized protein n=1 Tax=Fervidobacterium gondwanense DSM 13020 TaxID=1121883 RepID=A0A1M7TF25_FERGO|nr:hypothetical protein [Fervidobacterium gondwanense]SHN69253.1 hypothetical protein SAMN02745226_01925 [Fervidobacterium gondwanense DSM 13020]